jgi:diguanylate cyclase
MNAWQFALVFTAGITSGIILYPLARMIESKGVDHLLDALARIVTTPFRKVRNVLGKKNVSPGDAPRKHLPPFEAPPVDPREQQLDDAAQTIRGMLLSLAATIQRTDKAAGDSSQALDDVRHTIDSMNLPGDLRDMHALLLGEIDRMITSNNSLQNELLQSQEVLATQREQIENLKTAVRIDGMTQLANRAFFDEKLTEMTLLRDRYQDSFSLLLIDVDNFKVINDTYGHQGGDRILKGVAYKIRVTLRLTDFVARFGGDEFAVVLMKASAREAEVIARKLCEEVETSKFILDGNEIRATLSIGVAEAEAGEREESVLKRADMALYQVKHSGRNGVAVAPTLHQETH